MEAYYYNRMTKQQQAAYQSILTGIKNLSDEFQIPALEKEELYNVFFQMRLDHPEMFWATGYQIPLLQRFFQILSCIPEYLV